jgi:ssDNA-binding replication factor A large subunit
MHPPQGGMSNGVHIMPISGINAYATKWTMKARVISKGSRTYKNAKGEGKLLNVEFADAHVRSLAFLLVFPKWSGNHSC